VLNAALLTAQVKKEFSPRRIKKKRRGRDREIGEGDSRAEKGQESTGGTSPLHKNNEVKEDWRGRKGGKGYKNHPPT